MRRKLLTLLLASCVFAPIARSGEPAPSRTELLVRSLGSDSFAKRQTAFDALKAMGRDALPVLERHLDDEDPEVARLVKRLILAIRGQQTQAFEKALELTNGAFEQSDEFEKLVARGHAVLEKMFRVLDEEDQRYPAYDYWRMRNAYAVIAKVATRKDVTALLARLNSPNPQHRYLLAPILISLPQKAVVSALLGRLSAASCPPIERAQILEMCRGYSALTARDERFSTLAKGLLESPNPDVRVAAVDWFAYSSDASVLPQILKASRDKDPDVRVAAIRALRNRRSDKARAAVLALLNDPGADVRAAAIQAVRSLMGPDSAPLIRPFLRDPDPMVRANAAQTLASFGDKAAVPALVHLLRERDSQFLSHALFSVVNAVARLGDQTAVPALRKLLEDADAYPAIASYKAFILSAILNLGGAAEIPKLKKWLEDPQLQNRQVVLDTLGQIDSPDVEPILVDALGNGTRSERTSAVRALLRRGDRASAPAILAAMKKEDDPWFLREATNALVAFGDKDAVPILEPLFHRDPSKGQNIGLFYSLIRAAVRFHMSGMAPRIAEITIDQSNYRYRGVDALGRLGNPKVVPGLTGLFQKTKSNGQRYRIALALARLGRPAELKKILRAPDTSLDPLVRAEGLVALGEKDRATRILDDALRSNPKNATYLYNVACSFAQLGEPDKAFPLLEKACGIRKMSRQQLENDVDLDPLRDDPRFEKLLKLAR